MTFSLKNAVVSNLGTEKLRRGDLGFGWAKKETSTCLGYVPLGFSFGLLTC